MVTDLKLAYFVDLFPIFIMLMFKSKFIQRFLFVFLLLSTFQLTEGQIYRTFTSTTVVTTSSYVQVYEYNTVESKPNFPGGNPALMRFINSERHYPAEAFEKGIQGRVVCGFVVNPDGHISDVTVMKSIEESLDKEAIRVISNMPPWQAGTIADTPVPVFCVLAIPFRR